MGRGERFGLAPLRDGRMYAFAVANVPQRARSGAGELSELRRRFGGWHEPIPEILSAADEASILRNDVEEIPPLDGHGPPQP